MRRTHADHFERKQAEITFKAGHALPAFSLAYLVSNCFEKLSRRVPQLQVKMSEKTPVEGLEGEKTPQEVDHVGDTSGRRHSVAMNIVENPLKRHSAAQTVENARVFAETHGMSEHAALFGRAGLVARDPHRFESVSELDEAERAALVYERDHKWHGPKMLWYSIGLCAVGAATQGWDQTGSNGANLSFPQEFGIDGEGRDEWIVGVINAIIFLTAGLMYVPQHD